MGLCATAKGLTSATEFDCGYLTYGRFLIKAGDDLVKIFEISRLQDKRMREAVDSFFGEGFCDDVFQEVRLTAAVDGLTVVDNLLFSVIDLMDADVNENLVKRNERIARYTEKYQRRKK